MWINIEIINEKGNKERKHYRILSKYFPWTAFSEAHNKTQDALELREKGTSRS